MEEVLPGFRFYPTEEELVSFYLRHQLEGQRHELQQVIPVVEVYNVEPGNLPNLAGQRCRGDTEQWFFFAPRQEREAKGGRPSRTTKLGYWKATGSPGYVYSSDNRVIGVKKSMVFYKGRAPTGRKTKWKMNEYRAIQEEADSSCNPIPKLRHEFSLCRVYVVSGSFRAFDRRPLESRARDAQAPDEAAGTSAKAPIMVQETSSTDTSYSGGDPTDQLPEAAGSINWELVGDLASPLWEWEQLGWP